MISGTCRSSESLKSEIDRVRSKLLGSSCLGSESQECGRGNPNLKKEESACESCDQENTDKERQAQLHPDKNDQIKKSSTVDFCVSSEPEKPGGGECESEANVCHEKGIMHSESETFENRINGGIDDREIKSSATHTDGQFRIQNIGGSPLASHATKRNHAELSVTAIEVSVSGHKQGSQFASTPAQSKEMTFEISQKVQKHSESDQVKPLHRNKGYPIKSTHNLSKSPISVITLKTASNGLCTCGEMLLDKGFHEDKLTPISKSKEEDLLVSTSLDVNTVAKIFHPETEIRSAGVSVKNDRSDATIRERERPAVRRRLSKTIQHLQEKIQKEMENNEYKSGKENEIQRRNVEPKKISTKLTSRFVRERSRRRSKSRIGFKVLQSSRKYPQVQIKERPYRQWIGVGNCVAHDSRFIVSSNCSQDHICLADSINSSSHILPRKGEEGIVVGEKEERKEQIKKLADVISHQPCTDTDLVSKNLHILDQSNEVSDSISENGSGTEERTTEIPKPVLGVAHKLFHADKALNSSNISSSELSNKEDICKALSSNSKAPAQERSRCIRRSSLQTDRRIRPPTPHSDFPCGITKNSKLPFNQSKCRTASRRRIASGTMGFKGHALSVPSMKQNQSGQKRKPSGFSGEESPTKVEFGDTIRKSKLFTAAPKQQRKSTLNGYSRKNNEIALQNQTQKSPCDMLSASSEDTGHRGSLETLWSDVSTTTRESSTRTESSSSWFSKDVSGNHGNAALVDQSSPGARGTTAEADGAARRRSGADRTSRVSHTRRYVDVKVCSF